MSDQDRPPKPSDPTGPGEPGRETPPAGTTSPLNGSLDIGDVLSNWDYVPGEVSARRIVTGDGKPKLQLRVDLGLMQLELEGRPDGQRPHGAESLLEHHLARRDRHMVQNGSLKAFQLTMAECEALRNESLLYYYRYLSLFRLGDWQGVERDTTRNLRCLNLLRRHGPTREDRRRLEIYRPYIMMMNARARAHRLVEQSEFDAAAEFVAKVHTQIEKFVADNGELLGDDHAEEELEILHALGEYIDQQRPRPRFETLNQQLAEAIAGEDYEEAVRLRDELARLPNDAVTRKPIPPVKSRSGPKTRPKTRRSPDPQDLTGMGLPTPPDTLPGPLVPGDLSQASPNDDNPTPPDRLDTAASHDLPTSPQADVSDEFADTSSDIFDVVVSDSDDGVSTKPENPSTDDTATIEQILMELEAAEDSQSTSGDDLTGPPDGIRPNPDRPDGLDSNDGSNDSDDQGFDKPAGGRSP